MKPKNRPFILLGVAIVMSIYILASGPLFIPYLPIQLTQVFGILLILWAFLSIKLNKDHQKLPNGYFLTMKGPYEIIRHPMYAGVLLILSGFVYASPVLFRNLAFVIFVAALVIKMLHEEQVLEEQVKEYKAYKEKTHKLIPYLF